MSVIREIPPTAGFPLSIRELFASWTRSRYPGSLEKDFSGYLNAVCARIVCSGTSGLYYIAATIKELSGKRTVIVPAFICPSVVFSLARAGFKVHACDVNADTFDYDLKELARVCAENNDIAAVVVVHLGGLPADMDRVSDITRPRGIIVVEDCAQSLGAEYHGRKVGTIGDISFFSLACGKGLTIFEGGAVVVNSARFVESLDRKISELEQADFWGEVGKIVELAGYMGFYRPQFFWWVYRLPEFFWKLTGQRMREAAEHFTFDFPTQKVSDFRKWAGHAGFGRLETAIEHQRRIAGKYREALRGVPGISFMEPPADCRATFPYVTLLLDDDRVNALRPLKKSGWGVSESFSLAIPDYGYLKGHVTAGKCLNARFFSQHLLTLSTSSFMTEEDVEKICCSISERCLEFRH